MKLNSPPKLVKKRIWVPVISFWKVFIPSYMFDGLLCWNWPFLLPNHVTLQITLTSKFQCSYKLWNSLLQVRSVAVQRYDPRPWESTLCLSPNPIFLCMGILWYGIRHLQYHEFVQTFHLQLQLSRNLSIWFHISQANSNKPTSIVL